MKASGSSDEKVVAKNPELPRRWQSKSSLGSEIGGPLFKKFHPPLTESAPQVGDLHPVTVGSVIVASVGSGAQLPHTDVATHPEVLPSDSRDISGCHVSSFLCLLEDYQVAVQGGTVLGEAGEARWDTIRLQRGDMLLMVATSRHHGLRALPNAKDGLQGAFFDLLSPDPRHRHHHPNTMHLDPPPPPRRPWLLLGICPAGSSLAWTRFCRWGRGWLGGWGCGRGVLPRLSSPTPPTRSRSALPRAPSPPLTPSSPAPPRIRSCRHGDCRPEHAPICGESAPDIEICKGDNVDAESEIHFAMSGVAPPVRSTTLWHLVNSAPAWRSPRCSKARAWSITCPCDCKVCLLVCLLSLLANWTKFT